MKTHGRRVCLAVLSAAVLWPAAARAQGERGSADAAAEGAGRRTISATGASTIQRKPTQLRLYMQLVVKGKTLKEALAKMKERQEAAMAQLETLKADKKSTVFGAANLFNDQSSRRRQIQAMIVTQMKSRGKKVPKGLLTPQTVTVASTLTTRWPLESESHEKMLLMAQGLQEKIKAADLAGAKEVEKLTPEEEEFEEEANQMQSQYGEEAQQPGQPHFMFVAVLPKEERQKALADAFAKAKQRAAELAQAAGVELGPLVNLSGGSTGRMNAEMYARYASSYGSSDGLDFMRQMVMDETTAAPDEKDDEAIGNDPSALRFNYHVTATFQLGK